MVCNQSGSDPWDYTEKSKYCMKSSRPPFMDQKLRLVLSEGHVQGIKMVCCVDQGNKLKAEWYRERLRMYVQRIRKALR